ncbi:10101_t:CDS:2 [Diversispora eburnea]|uniref:10101_t:CDS:1 n=1 Tax=Diversispora eburnea TaxID=1213867 RepID=A0A9N9AT44_9GLOM|nr:10101_t:CDS:2 [Diversispora eburnea]
MNELQNIRAVNRHRNIIKFYGVSIDPKEEKCYLVFKYAEDNLRNYLRNKNNFENLDWETKVNMAQDIAYGLCFIHNANIVHRDLHSKNILVHKGKLLITDLGLSKSLDSNSNSLTGGMLAYSDPEYLQNSTSYKRNKPSDIYSLGVLFWEISSGRPPFDKFIDFEICEKVKSGKKELPINGTPENYIKIYTEAWKDDPKQRPTIENICDSLENIQFEKIYYDSNENDQFIQKVNPNNQLNKFKSMESYSKDSISLENLGIAVLENPGEPSTISLNSYDQEWLNYGLNKFEYNDFENLEDIGENVHNATLMNGTKVTLKSIVVNSMELFVNEGKREIPIEGTPQNYVKIYQDCWNQDPDQRPNIEKVIKDLE